MTEGLKEVERQLADLMDEMAGKPGLPISQWIALRMRDAADRALSKSSTPMPGREGAWTKREGCVGEMTPSRAIYFLDRFKRDEKMLGPHEQWALDYTMSVLASLRQSPNTSREGEI